MRDSSLEAFEKIKGTLSEERGRIFLIIAGSDKPICDYEISQIASKPINGVTGRRHDLEQMEYIKSVGKSIAPPADMPVHHFVINPKCLEPDFVPKPLKKKTSIKRETIVLTSDNVSMAARIMAEHRNKKRKKAMAMAMPSLFGNIF